MLNGYIGHFPTTSNLDGNVGLAAHNRGYNKMTLVSYMTLK